MLNYLLLFLCQLSLLCAVDIPTFLILLSLPYIVFFGFIFSLLDHLSFNFFGSLAVMEILDHDVGPNRCFFNIFDEIITAFKKIFFSLCLEMKHFIYDNTSLMIVLGYWLDTAEHCSSLRPFLPHTWHLNGFIMNRSKDNSLFWTQRPASGCFRNVRCKNGLWFSKIDSEN